VRYKLCLWLACTDPLNAFSELERLQHTIMADVLAPCYHHIQEQGYMAELVFFDLVSKLWDTLFPLLPSDVPGSLVLAVADRHKVSPLCLASICSCLTG
jgi:hypothetical protein